MRCAICLEEWDLDSIHEEVKERWPNKPWITPLEELPVCRLCGGKGIRPVNSAEAVEFGAEWHDSYLGYDAVKELAEFPVADRPKCNGCNGYGRTDGMNTIYGPGPLYHNQAKYEKYFHEVKNDFVRRGCVALGGSPEYCVKSDNQEGRSVVYMLHDLLGDDVDGIEAMTEDAEQLGLF